MKIRAVLILASSLAFSGAMAADSPARPEKKPNSSTKAPLALEKGMSAETVIKALGKPDTIKPMASPEGKAETWTYRRLLKRDTRQTATSLQSRPTFSGTNLDANGVQPTTMEPAYSIEYIETYQVTSLLMFNDQLILAKQWVEQQRDFN